MVTKIGIAAGEIWHYLDEHGKVKLSMLLDDLAADEYLVLMSLGWLAREGHVIMEDNASNVHDFEVYLRRD